MTTIIGLVLLSPTILAQENGPNTEQMRERMDIMDKYPGKFNAFYSLTYKMTPQEKELFQKTVNKLEAEKQFNDLMNQEKQLKEKLSKAGNKQIQSTDGRILTERQLYNEKLIDIKQKRIDAGVKYSVLKQEQAEEEKKQYTAYQALYQKEEALRKKYYSARSTGYLEGKDGRMMTEKQMIEEELQEVRKQRIDVAKKVTLLSEDKYIVGGIKQLYQVTKPSTIKENSETTQNWGNAKPLPTISSNTNQNWGNAKQGPSKLTSTKQSWGNAKQTTTSSSLKDTQSQNEVTTIAPGSSKIISQDLINLANTNVKSKNTSFGTAIGEYITGIPENVLDEAFRMSSIKGLPGTFIDNYNNNLLKLIRKYGIPLNNIAIIQTKALPKEESQPATTQTAKKTRSECFLPNGELDNDCFMRKIMPSVMDSVNDSINKIPINY